MTSKTEGTAGGVVFGEKEFGALLEKVEKLKRQGGVDLSTAEDLSVAVMNLISLEEHFFFTGAKTGDGSYYDLSSEVRSLRKTLLGRLIEKHEGETWCISKHLLAAAMRLIEVGGKLRAEGDGKESEAMFKRAYRLYSIFWALKLKLVDAVSLGGDRTKDEKKWTLEELVTKLADCCDE